MFALPGVPESRPVVVLNTAQLGLFWMENVTGLPSGSLAFGWKKYHVPTGAVVAGVPLIVGAAAKAQSGASNTANSERATAIVGTRAARARAFLIEVGMHIPSRVTTTRRRTRRSSHPHTENFRTARLDPGRPSHA